MSRKTYDKLVTRSDFHSEWKPMLKQIESGCYASGSRPSEDACGYVLDEGAVFAWVIDGATGIAPSLSLSPVHSDAEWYALRINRRMHQTIAMRDGDADVRALLITAIEAANADFRAIANDRMHMTHLLPSASIVLAHVARNAAGFLVSFAKLGDCGGVWRAGSDGEVRIVESTLGPAFDQEFDELAVRLTAAGKDDARRSAVLSEIAARLLARRRTMNQPNGYFIAAPNWMLDAIVSESFLCADPPAVMLLSDGATRLMEKFGLCNLDKALRDVLELGIARFVHRVREIENSDPTCHVWPRLKKSDDASIVALEFCDHGR